MKSYTGCQEQTLFDDSLLLKHTGPFTLLTYEVDMSKIKLVCMNPFVSGLLVNDYLFRA